MNHQDSPTKCSYPLCYDEATTSSGTCVRHSTAATPSTPKPNNIDPLTSLLERYKTYVLHAYTYDRSDCYQVGDDPHFGISEVEAKAAIELLMVQERIEELRRFTGHGISIHQHSIAKRIAELEQQLKPNHESETI